MLISEVCIKRPVFATVLSLVIVVLGLMFYSKLPLRGIPDIDPPIIFVSANYYGADASYMERNITKPIEKALRTVKNVNFTQSESSSGSANITIVFDLSANIEVSLSDVRSKISSISYLFPADMKAPSVEKMDSGAQPVFWIVAESDSYDEMTLTDIMYQHTVKSLEKMTSIGRVLLFGARYYTMSIMPDPVAMYALKMTPNEIEDAIRAQTKDYPAGYIKTDSHNYVLTLKGQINSEEEFKKVIVRSSKDGGEVRLEQVAKVRLEPYDKDVILRYNGGKGIALGLVKQSKSNVLELSSDVRKEFKSLQEDLPAGIKLTIAYDGATSVEDSVRGVFFTIVEALLLVVGVMYLFLQSPKITIIPFVTIPISLIGSFSFMYALGFSINTFTLLAMTLAVGLVVDDAIVILENIFRRNEEGESPMTAAINGSQEIGFAIIAMTITLAAVFLPIGFVQGFVGKIFIEFAWTLAVCVLVSGFVALTLTPMMASRMMGDTHTTPPLFVQKFQILISKVEEQYLVYLHILFIRSKEFWMICAGSILMLFVCLISVEKVFSPMEDVSALRLLARGPEGSSLIHSDLAMQNAEPILKSHKDIFGYFTVTGWGGSDTAGGFVILKPQSKRSKSQNQIAADLNAHLQNIPEMTMFVQSPPSLASGDASAAVEFNLSTTDGEWAGLDKASQSFISKMEASKIFSNVDRDLKTSIPTLDIIIDRAKAYLYGVPISSIGSALQYLITGQKVGDFVMGGDTYEVNLRYDKDDKNKISDLSKIYLKTKDNNVLSLDAVADIQEKISTKSYNHYNGAKSVKITANLNQGHNIGSAIKFLDDLRKDALPDKIDFEYLGEIQRMNESNTSMLTTFGLALIFIYLVLSAQFESFTDPLIILCAVPFSISGGLLALLVGFDSFNLYSNIGLITLVGLITKHSIMIVEFANQLMMQGQSATLAAANAAKLRLRPILMTTMATICGSLPLVLSSGTGSEARHSIGLVIVGGMALGTLFTIFVIPVLYQKFKR
ncbi:MAG: efflux RND transporter permease subunit [Pseudomonadota bacterium]